MTLSMIKNTGRLSLEITSILEKEKKPGAWVKKLERGSQVAQLYSAIVHVPNFQNYPTLRQTATQAEAKIQKLRADGDLPRYAEDIYKLAKKYLTGTDTSDDKGAVDLPTDDVPPQDNPPPEIINTEGIPNLGANCWLCGTLQLLRSTPYFDSIIATGPTQENAKLRALRTNLQEILRRLRANEGLDKVHIESLLTDLKKADFIKEKYVQRDPEEILIKLAASLGHIETLTIGHHFNYSDGVRNNFWTQEAAEETLQIITLEVRKPNLSTQQLINSNFFKFAGNVLEQKVHFIVRDAQGTQIANYDNAFCRNEAKIALEAQDIVNPPEELLHTFQKAEIVRRHPNASCEVVPLFQHLRRIQHYPPFVEVLINKFGGDHQVQLSLDIDLANPQQNGLNAQPAPQAAPQPYALKSVICRSGVALNGAPGHIWYLLRDREHNSWKRYNDLDCTPMTNEAALAELAKYAYACFYENAQQAQPAQQPQNEPVIATSTTPQNTAAKK
jgi:hypothetical protein